MSRPRRAAATKAASAISSTCNLNDNDKEYDEDENNISGSGSSSEIGGYQHRTRKTRNKDSNFALVNDSENNVNEKGDKDDNDNGYNEQPENKRSKRQISIVESSAITTNNNDPSTIQDLEDLFLEASIVFGRPKSDHSNSYHHFKTTASRVKLQKNLLAWYDIAKRTMPWRKVFTKVDRSIVDSGQRAYEVWVSEIMCQQTQVATVIPYYNNWMSKWPTMADLAKADIEDINKAWAGLGYYSRAKRLLEGAQKVMKEFGGVLPSDPAVLEKEIPGVGRYTAGAIASVAYNVPTEIVDGNVIRVLSRLRAMGGDVKSPKVIDLHWQVAKEIVHETRPGCFNQALMELGALVCTPTNPKCGECPVQSSCRAFAEVRYHQGAVAKLETATEPLYQSQEKDVIENIKDNCLLCIPLSLSDPDLSKELGIGSVTQYPRKALKKAPRDEECAVAILERTRGDDDQVNEYLVVKRPLKGLLAGMWEFPTVEQDQLVKDHLEISKSTLDITTNKKQEIMTAKKSGSKNSKTLSEIVKAESERVQTTYDQRSKSTMQYLKSILGVDLNQYCERVEKKDLGKVQHLFSHIRKVYHAEWVQAIGWKESADGGQQSHSAPEMQWLTKAELLKAAIPTGIAKTFQLLEEHKDKKARGGGVIGKAKKRRQNGNDEIAFDEDEEGEDVETKELVAKKRKRGIKVETGNGDISKFFLKPKPK